MHDKIKRIKVTPNFYLDELVDPVTYFSQGDYGLSLLDINAVNCLQLLRDLKGSSITVNNWWFPYLEWAKENPKKFVSDFAKIYVKRGNFQWSGYRSALCKIGAPKSAHKLGKAFDPKGDEQELFKLVKDNAKVFYDKGLRRLEDISITNGWLHIDTESRNCKPNSIKVIDKTKCTETIYL